MMPLMRELHSCKRCKGITKGTRSKRCLKEACPGQALIRNPSKKDYEGMVRSNMIANCPVSTSDVSNARAIFGPDLASVHGKTVRRTPAPVVVEYVAVPWLLVKSN